MSANPVVLDDCGCCETTSSSTPAIYNPPGLGAISYRIGTQPVFKARMIAALEAARDLAALTTRDDSDPALGLVDAWATVLDVLSFYQERIATEGYLRTAGEAQSVYSLAAEIGYLPSPGVAADVWLAFQLDTSPGAPREATIPAGTRVQSLPEPNAKPQTFETVDDAVIARPEWNALRASRSADQVLQKGDTNAVFTGTATLLRPGDGLLFLAPSFLTNTMDKEQMDTDWAFRVLSAVQVDPVEGTTTVSWVSELPDKLIQTANPRVFAMRTRASIFGFNAPDWGLIHVDIRKHYDSSATDETPTQWPDFTVYARNEPKTT
jgi:hypothetical protein